MYKMATKQLVLKKRSHYFFSSSVLLKDFDKTSTTMIVLIDMFIILTVKNYK